MDDVDRRLETTIGDLLDQRRPEASICPSEAARAVDPDGWRELMPAARAAAGRLAAAGQAEVTQGGGGGRRRDGSRAGPDPPAALSRRLSRRAARGTPR